jgi:hypothetical protein
VSRLFGEAKTPVNHAMRKLFHSLIFICLLTGSAAALTPTLGCYKRGDWVSFAARPKVTGTKFTITAWVRFADGATGTAVGNAYGNDIRIGDGKIQGIVYNTTGEIISLETTAEYSDSAWHFVAIVREDLLVKLHVDNKLRKVGYFAENKVGVYEIPGFCGGSESGKSDSYKGALNGVRFYNYALSSAEISALYNNGVFTPGSPAAGLVGGWDLTEGRGTKVADFSGNNNHGTISNMQGFTIGQQWIADRDRTTPKIWYATPAGSLAKTGESVAEAWDLHTAFSHPPPMLPGDTIILPDGSTFAPTEPVNSYLTGTAAKRITVRANSPIGHFPNAVKIDGAGLTVNGPKILNIYGKYVDYCDLEIYKSTSDRISSLPGSLPSDIVTNGGVKVWGAEIKLLYPHVHDTNSEGIAVFDPKGSIEIIFPLLYNNGWTGKDGPHGHGLYAHNNNRNATVTWRHVVTFNNYYHNIQHYTSQYQYDSYNQHFEGIHAASAYGIALVGASPKHNFIVRKVDAYNSGLVMGYGDEDNYDIVADDIYAYGFNPSISFKAWRSISLTNSVSIATNPGLTGGMMKISKVGGALGRHTFSNNIYYGGVDPNLNQMFTVFRQNGVTEDDTYKTFAQWQTLGFDTNSKFYYGAAGDLKPTTNVIRYYADDLTAGRGLFVVWNWQNLSSVSINLSNFNLTGGQSYKIYNAMNPAAAPVFTGTYNAARRNVNLSMTSNGVAKRFNDAKTTPADTLPEFGMFLVVPSSAASRPEIVQDRRLDRTSSPH